MKAIVIDRYGSADVLQYQEVEQPKIKPSELLVQVQATSVNPADWKNRQGTWKWLVSKKFPKIYGFDVSGKVVQVGNQVTRFQPGDEIYASLSFEQVYGIFFPSKGAYAEFVAVAEKFAAPKPINLSHSEAGVVPLAARTSYYSRSANASLPSRIDTVTLITCLTDFDSLHPHHVKPQDKNSYEGSYWKLLSVECAGFR